MKNDQTNYLPYVLKFDGKDDRIVLPEMNVDYSQGFAVEAWVYYNSFKNWSRIIDFGNSPDNRNNIILANADRRNALVFIYITKGSDERIFAENALETGKWMHLAATVDATGNVKLYKNGQEIQSGKIQLLQNVNRTLNYIGQSNWTSDEYFDGKMAEVRLWNRDRTAEELQQDLHRRLQGNEAGLVGYWPLNEGKGDTVSKTGKINGAIWHQEIFFPATDRLSYPQNVLSFVAHNDYIDIRNPFVNDKEFTISLWVKPSLLNDGNYHGAIGKHGDQYRKPSLWLAPSKGGLQYDSYDPTGKRYEALLDNFFTAKDEWVHITWVKQGTEYRIYRNGELFATKPAPEAFYYNKDSNYYIGLVDSYWPGEIAQVSIWSLPRTQGQIKADMYRSLAGNETGLVGYWPLDEGVGDRANDKSSSSNHGKISRWIWKPGTAIASPNPIAEIPVLTLDGVDDCIAIADNPSLQIANYTVEIWIKPDGQPNETWKGIIGKPGRNFNIWLTNSGFIHHRFHNSATTNAGAPDTPTGAIAWDRWNHVAITNDGTTAKTYINGKLITEGPTGGTPIVDKTPLYIGCNLEGNKSNYFKGQITEARIWNLARTQEDIQKDMYVRLVGNETGLAIYWPLDESSGDVVNDRTQNNNQGRITGAIWQKESFINFPNPIGAMPSLLTFDGKDDYIVLSEINVDYSQGLTVEAWVYYNGFNRGARLIEFSNGEGKNNIIFANQGATDALVLDIKQGENGQKIVAEKALKTGNWMHLAATVDAAGNGKLYKNGQEIQSGKIYLPESLNRTSNYIGRSSSLSDGYFDGQMAEIRLWKRDRSQEELKQDMYRRLVGNEAGLVGYWPLNEGSGSKVSKSGTITGATWGKNLAKLAGQQLLHLKSTLSFHGQIDYVEIKDPFENNQEFTISLWVKPALINDGGWHGFIGKQGDRYRKPGLWLAPSNGGLHYDSYDIAGTRYGEVIDKCFLAKDQWVHISWVKQGTQYKFYRNGERFATKPAPESFYHNKETSYFIGRVENFWPGELAEVSIWNHARSEAEIKGDLYATLAGNELGLVGYWPLNEGTGDLAIDKNSRGNLGKIYGATWKRQNFLKPTDTSEQNFIKSAAKFDGQDDRIVLPEMNVDYSQGFAVEAWVYYNSFKKWSRVIDFGNGSDKDNIVFANANGTTTLVLDIKKGAAGQRIAAENALETGKWMHLAATVDAAGNVKLYKNGQEIKSGKIQLPANLNRTVNYIARSNWTSEEYFDGKMSEVRVWNRDRSREELQKDMNRRLTGNEAGLVSYWPLNEGPNTRIADKASNKSHGTITGASWVESQLPITASATNQQTTNAQSVLSFDGKSNYVQCGNALNLANTSFSVEFWTKRTATKMSSMVVAQGVRAQNQGLHIGFRDNDMFTFAFYGNDLNTPTNLMDTEWHHWACTYDAKTKQQIVYRDGKKVAERVAAADYQGKGVFYIGCWEGKELYLFGQLTELRIWKVARTVDGIKADMNRRLTGNEADLMAYWPLNEGRGTQVFDRTSNSKYGIVNGSLWPIDYQSDYLQSVLKFDGKDDYVAIADPFANDKEFTIFLWVKPSVLNDGGWHGLIGKEGDQYRKPGLWMTPNQSGLHYDSFDQTGQRYAESLNNFFEAKDQWVHIAWVKQGTEYKFYRNGELFATKPASESFYTKSDTSYYIGRVDNFWAGDIADVRIWSCARSQDDIQADMHYRLVANEPGATGYWPLDEGIGETVADRTVRGNHGQIIGATWERQVFFANEVVSPPRSPELDKSELKQKLAELEQKNAEQEKKISDQDKKISELEKENAEQKNKNSELEQKNSQLEQENTEQKTKLSQLEQENAEQKKKISELEQKNSELEQENTEQKTKLSQLEQKNSQLEQENTEQKTKLSQLEQQNAEQKKKLSELEQKNSQLERENAEQKKKLSELEQKNSQLEQENAEQKKKLSELEQENAEQKKKLSELEQENAEQKKKLSELEQENAELENKNSELEQKSSQPDKKEWQQLQKLQPTELKSESFFGEEAAISGEWAIAGARKADGAGIEDAGAAYILQLQNNKWQEKQKLQPTDSRVDDQFGCAVAIKGEWSIVGAHKADDSGKLNAGAAYIFQLENGVWQQKQKLQPDDLAASAFFGKGIAIAAEWAMIGASHAKVSNIPDAGSAYVFRLENGVWQQKQKLQPKDLSANQGFGHTIAIDGDWAIVGGGDRYASANIQRPGGAYLYHLENGVWQQKQKLQSPQPGVNDLFGYSVAISGECAFVGAVNTTVSNLFGSGTVYTYQLENGVWQLKQKLQSDRAKYCGFFGATVAIAKDIAVVGSTRGDSSSGKDSGNAYLYQLENGVWQFKQKLQSSDLHYESYFGFSTPTDGNWVFITAAWANRSSLKRVGAVYIFEAQ